MPIACLLCFLFRVASTSLTYNSCLIRSFSSANSINFEFNYQINQWDYYTYQVLLVLQSYRFHTQVFEPFFQVTLVLQYCIFIVLLDLQLSLLARHHMLQLLEGGLSILKSFCLLPRDVGQAQDFTLESCDRLLFVPKLVLERQVVLFHCF